MWLDDLDDAGLVQATNLANLPFAFKHIAIMPDAHVGYGMPIGAVLATKGVIIPNAIGKDIGCGMCAVRTSLQEMDKGSLKKIMALIRKTIPLGFSSHKSPQDESLMPEMDEAKMGVVAQHYSNALCQLGTLGGGNHFIEIQQGDDGYIWLMVHSGSRNLGNKVATYHDGVAKSLNELWHSAVPKSWQLAFLPLSTQEGEQYFTEMNFCLEYALANRKLMMQHIQNAMVEVMGVMEFGELINKSHNFAAWENHSNANVLVHRKGATRARKGEVGLIPGSQGTFSYIVKGLGNESSFHSCSHGAGRCLGRKEAVCTLNLKDELERLKAVGVIHAIRN